ncbi:hypothetical protein J2Z40_002815 [Cytobacillus eiseniae]|uniref:Uncharacterized protein n=1 Tax=Cytobacillus eiseniae TaxID=762947 RepID=A0ABS4RH80_9BACI|nr:hypothetical protein [Cytobacillus eiseniae]MBP2242241.1 hypothetical protein [Cytobacillus eiseniae]
MKIGRNLRKIRFKKSSKILTGCGAILLGIILVIVYLPQGKLAALLPVQNPVAKTDINQPEQEEIATPLEEEKTEDKEETTNIPPEAVSQPSTENTVVSDWYDEGAALKNGGRDMSNDPEYQAELK